MAGLLELKNCSHGGRKSNFTPANMAIPNAQGTAKRPAITIPMIRTIGFASRLRFFFLAGSAAKAASSGLAASPEPGVALPVISAKLTFSRPSSWSGSAKPTVSSSWCLLSSLNSPQRATPRRAAVGRLGGQIVNFLGRRCGRRPAEGLGQRFNRVIAFRSGCKRHEIVCVLGSFMGKRLRVADGIHVVGGRHKLNFVTLEQQRFGIVRRRFDAMGRENNACRRSGCGWHSNSLSDRCSCSCSCPDARRSAPAAPTRRSRPTSIRPSRVGTAQRHRGMPRPEQGLVSDTWDNSM